MLTCINDVGWWEVERGRKGGWGEGGGLAGMCGLVGSVLAWPGESRDTQKPARRENTHARTDTHIHTHTRTRMHARTHKWVRDSKRI